jgi:hypothetical protein
MLLAWWSNGGFWLLGDQMKSRRSHPLSRDEQALLARNHRQPRKPT